MKITFNTKEIKAMCLERVAKIETNGPGKFEADVSTPYYNQPEVTCTFITEDELVEREAKRRAALLEVPSSTGSIGVDAAF